MISFGAYRPDVSDFQGEHTQVLSNVIPRGDGYGPVQALQSFTDALAAQCRGYFYARATDGTIVVFAATSTKLYKLDNTALTWSDVSKGATTYTTIPSTDQWQFAQFGDTVVAVQANTAPQFYTLASSSAFADLGGTPPNAKSVAIVGRFVVLTGLTSNPRRVHWSDLDGITTWSAGTGFANFVDLPDGGVVRGVAGGEFGLIFQESVIRQMVYVPGAKPAFQIERVTEDRGLLATYSVCKAGDKIFFISQQGFFAYTAAAGLVPIGKEKVDRTFLADVDLTNAHLLIGSGDPAGTRVYWAYKSIRSSTTTAFDTMLAYDWALDLWSASIAASGEYMTSLVKPAITLDALDTIYGNLDAIPFSLDSIQSALVSRLSAVTSAHKLGFFDGANLEASLETHEQGVGDSTRVIINGFRPVSDAGTVYGSLKVRSRLADALTQTTETAMNSNGVCTARVDTRYARGKIRIPAGTTWTFAAGIEPIFAPTGQQ